MEPTYAFDYSVIAWFLIGGIAFVAVGLGTARLLQHRKPERVKSEIYECGVEPIGPPWVKFHAGYYVYALLFVIFDIETVFLYPWALVFGQPASTWFVFGEMVIFVLILVGGLAYAWKEGALRWH